MARNTRNAFRSLSSVEPSDYAALAALDSETLSALLRRVRLAVRDVTSRADETESLASLICGRLYSGNVESAARAAVRLASETVRQAYAGTDSLDEWAESFGDMVETVVHAGADRADIPRAWCPRPDSPYGTTDGDVVRAALDSLDGTEHGRILRDAARAYAEHGERRCHLCSDVTSAGRRVSLVGILAHTRGLSGSDSEYHALRRTMLAALRSLDVTGIRSEHYYPYAEGGSSGSVSLDRPAREHGTAGETGLPVSGLTTPHALTETVVRHVPAYVRSRADGSTFPWEGDPSGPSESWLRTYAGVLDYFRPRTVTTLRVVRVTTPEHITSAPAPTPDTERVTVRHADGTVETHTESHYAALRAEARADRSPEDLRADRIAESIAGAPSRAVRRSERKRSGGTGAYGSQVGARPGQTGEPWHPMPKR